jgi:hypothetical protein
VEQERTNRRHDAFWRNLNTTYATSREAFESHLRQSKGTVTDHDIVVFHREWLATSRPVFGAFNREWTRLNFWHLKLALDAWLSRLFTAKSSA